MRYKHIGYFNDKEDIRALFNGTQKDIIEWWKEGYGNFFTPTEDYVEEYKEFIISGLSVLGNDGDQYIVVESIPTCKKDISQDDFIDIYELTDETDEEK